MSSQYILESHGMNTKMNIVEDSTNANADDVVECLICGNTGGPNSADKLHSHYGAVCCLGCKAFFRRTIRENRSYVCKSETNGCDIDPRSRIKCKQCRYTKVCSMTSVMLTCLKEFFQCLEVGMDPSQVLISKEERKKFTNHRKEKDKASLCDTITQNCTLSWAEVGISDNVIQETTAYFLDPSNNRMSRHTFVQLFLAYMRHFSNFASKTSQFTALPEDQKAVLSRRNIPLLCHYIMASCLVADTGLEQLSWMLGPYAPAIGKCAS